MSVRAHPGKSLPPALEGRFWKFTLAPVDFLVPDPEAAADSRKLPYVLMHMPKRGGLTRVVVPEPTTAVDNVTTPADAPPTPRLAAGSEEVTGLIERLHLAGAASNSDGEDGGGVVASGGAAACAEGGTMLAHGARCEITGLVAAPKHNGKRCTLTVFSESSGRWEVDPKP